MATTYVPANIGSIGKDRVRWRVGDVNGKPQWFLQDEEIEALLASSVFPDGSIQFDEICAECCENIGAQCIQLAQSVMQADLKLVYANRGEQAFALADRIRDKSMPPPGAPLERGAIAGPIHQGRDGLPREYDLLLGDRPEHACSPFDFPSY